MAKVGGLLKLDAICAKLKTNLKSSDDQGEIPLGEGAEHEDDNGMESYDVMNNDEPNNNTDTLNLKREKTLVTISKGSNASSAVDLFPLDMAGRKNRRKSQRPRSIANIAAEDAKEELSEYEENNPDVDFDSICEEAMEEEEDADEEGLAGYEEERVAPTDGYRWQMMQSDGESQMSCDEHEESHDLEACGAEMSKPVDCNDNDSGVLDLSVASSNVHSVRSHMKIADNEHDGEDSRADEHGALNLCVAPRNTTVKSNGAKTNLPSKSAGDEVEMKDYAENTMNELLSMYGLSEEGESISSRIPLKNFHPGSILGRSPFDRKNMPAKQVSPFSQGVRTFDLLPSLAKKMKMEMADEEDDDDEDEDSLSGSPGKPLSERFLTSEAYIKNVKMCFGNQMSPGQHDMSLSPAGRHISPDYYKYLKRFNSHEECKGNHCEDMAYKEHFHCLDCSFRVFVKKEEMIRHFKWHKKRDESLQHGFMRYSPMDDCSKKFMGHCSHNGKQTHYHCLQSGCSKVYISTSDVQMHANYHRKDSAILQEGFQRFRATEDCGSQNCTFYNQRTTHFHCRRPGCSFTFKNKADMEKHKTYHQKDEILAKDGFKKFMKYEHCNFRGCRYSKSSNHIHCIRLGCHYVLHSTGQLYSHKRKHERRDFENAYRRFKDNPMKSPGMPLPHQLAMEAFPNMIGNPPLAQISNLSKKEYVDMDDLVKLDRPNSLHISDSSSAGSEAQDLSVASQPSTPEWSEPNTPGSATVKPEPADNGYESKVPSSTIARLVSKLNNNPVNNNNSSLNLTIPGQSDSHQDLEDLQSPVLGLGVTPVSTTTSGTMRAPSPTMGICPGGFVPKVSPPVNEKKERDESWKKYLTRYTANDPCHSRCQFLYKDHYHCNTLNCGMLFRSKDGVREHAKFHEQQERITSLTFMTYEDHVMCTEQCQYNGKEKHFHCLWADCKHVISAVNDPVFSRMEHYKIHEYSRASLGRRMSSSPGLTIRTPESFKRRRGRPPKYPKNEIPQVPKIVMNEEDIAAQARMYGPEHCINSGFKKYMASNPCPDDKCMFVMKEHYHCVRPRCHHATDRYDVLNLHAKDFHSYICILEGFEFFDRTVNCRRPHCHNNRANRHFHCVRPRCDYSFVRVSTMAQHDKKHRMAEMGLTHSPSIAVPKLAFLPNNSTTSITTTQAAHPVSIAPRGLVRAAGTFYPITSSQPAMLTPGLVQVSNTAPIMVTMPMRGSTPRGMANVAPLVFTQVNNNPTNFTKAPVGRTLAAPLLVNSTATLMNAAPITKVSTTMATKLSSSQNTSASHRIISSGTTQLVNIAPKPPATIITTTPQLLTTTTMSSQTALPLTMLLQQKAPKLMPQPSWVSLLLKMHCGPHQNCGRPFCKLKKKDHFHCFECTQAFSDPLRLKSHIAKHGFHVDKSDTLQGRMVPFSPQVPAVATDEQVSDSESSASEDEEEGRSLNLVPGAFSNILSTSLDEDLIPAAAPTAAPAAAVMDLSVASNKPITSRKPVVLFEPATLRKSDKVKDCISKEVLVTPSEAPEPASPHLLQSLGLMKKDDDSSSNDAGDLSTRRSRRKRTATKHDDFVDSEAALSKTKIRRTSSPRVIASSPKQYSGPDSPVQASPNKITLVSQTSPSKVTLMSAESLDTEPADMMNNLTSTPSLSTVLASPPKPTREETITPDGYHKYKFNEDCQFERCAYRQSQSHYHCSRKDCGYAFCDRARFLQHNERHKRIMDLMGEEFEEFRANVDCGRPDCQFTRRSIHFHCLKCPFICTETTKVTAHRKHHAKQDNLSTQCFRKVTAGDGCHIADCYYGKKQTHYHCTRTDCNQVALGPAQMQAHKTRHDSPSDDK